ncbi:SURF1 family protein [Streptomyces sp. NPDC058372]|uniref:SURF1 family protein n=1 Tax=unclassified Streptomyces TaxID=2593676 RepID=UPI0036511F9B
MYRFLLTPRWWGINLFVVLAIPFCVLMGSWQLGRFEDRAQAHKEAEEKPVVSTEPPAPVGELLPVDKLTSGRVAEATGTYEDQFLVPARKVGDRDGFYVLTLLHQSDGAPALPVVRGWLPGTTDPDEAPAPPKGEVSLTGVLQAPEHTGSPGVYQGGGLPADQVGMISAASLVNLVPYGVADAWVTLTDGQPGNAGLTPVPPAATPDSGLDLKAFQNLGYTGEWFVFAGFVVFMWFRLLRRDAEVARDEALGIAPEGPPQPVAAPAADAPAPEAEDADADDRKPAPAP